MVIWILTSTPEGARNSFSPCEPQVRFRLGDCLGGKQGLSREFRTSTLPSSIICQVEVLSVSLTLSSQSICCSRWLCAGSLTGWDPQIPPGWLSQQALHILLSVPLQSRITIIYHHTRLSNMDSEDQTHVFMLACQALAEPAPQLVLHLIFKGTSHTLGTSDVSPVIIFSIGSIRHVVKEKYHGPNLSGTESLLRCCHTKGSEGHHVWHSET